MQEYQDSSKGNRTVFSTNYFGTSGYPPKKCWIDAEPPFLISYAKITSKWTIDLDVGAKIIKFLGKKVRNLCDIELEKAFMNMTAKTHFFY